MLAKFAVKNYRGFAEKIEWDLSHPSNYEFNPFAVKDGIIKNGIIYGPNGSGKTNFGLAVFDIVNHLTQKEKERDYNLNFAYAGNQNSPVEFYYEFRFRNSRVNYSYKKNYNAELLSEQLAVNDKVIFVRDGNDLVINKYDIEPYRHDEYVNNANKVSIVSALLSTYPIKEDDPLLIMKQFADKMLWFKNLEEDRYVGLRNGSADVEEYIIKNGLIADFEDFLSEVSKQHFTFDKQYAGHERLLWCLIDNVRIPFDIIRSTGTRALEFLFYWITKIDSISLIFIDEFDAFYHYEIAFNLCKKLFGNDCQLFLTSHNTFLMTNDLLRPDCNFILNRNTIKPLCDCTEKELRWGHNIEKLYRGGAFD